MLWTAEAISRILGECIRLATLTINLWSALFGVNLCLKQKDTQSCELKNSFWFSQEPATHYDENCLLLYELRERCRLNPKVCINYMDAIYNWNCRLFIQFGPINSTVNSRFYHLDLTESRLVAKTVPVNCSFPFLFFWLVTIELPRF